MASRIPIYIFQLTRYATESNEKYNDYNYSNEIPTVMPMLTKFSYEFLATKFVAIIPTS